MGVITQVLIGPGKTNDLNLFPLSSYMLVAFGECCRVCIDFIMRTLACQFEPDRYLALMAYDVANVQYFSRLTTFQNVII